MSWFIGLGGKEWNKFSIGQSQTARMAELLADTNHGGCPDLYLRLEVPRDHTIAAGDVKASAVMFGRSSVAFTPFVYPADYPERELQPIVASCNDLALGKAATALQTLIARKTTKPALNDKAQELKTLLDERVDAVLKLSQQLSRDDPVLFAWYSSLFTQQLAGHPRAKELGTIIASAKKDRKTQAVAAANWANFVQGFPNLFSGKPDLKPGAADFLKQVKENMPAQSSLGTMAGEFLELK